MTPITGRTRLAAVIGAPVRHSRSPAIHNAAFAATGLDWVYLAFEVPPGHAAAALEAVRTLGLAGLSVTMPHKADVALAVDELTPAASALGAVNCVVNHDGHLVGDTTDGGGFLDGLADDTGLDVAGRRIAVVGAGGAGRAVIEACGAAGAAEIVVVNRSPERAARAVEVGHGRAVVGEPIDLGRAELVVNATSVGMGDDAGLPFDPDLLDPSAVVVDLVYEPLQTPLLATLATRGITSANGLSMLVHQAARAFQQWTGVEAPLDAMRAAARAGPASRSDDAES